MNNILLICKYVHFKGPFNNACKVDLQSYNDKLQYTAKIVHA